MWCVIARFDASYFRFCLCIFDEIRVHYLSVCIAVFLKHFYLSAVCNRQLAASCVDCVQSVCANNVHGAC